jgi:acyl-CoA reductase-like NAD-dependent aldehyde dehydrogenase
VLDGYRTAGGRALCGDEWSGLTLAPTLVEGVPAAHPLVRDTEIFAPIATLHPCRDLDEMLALADDTPFGLQAGLFSDDETAIARALARLRVGTLVVNDAPNRRDDRLPYGGTRDSGVGREGTFDAVMDYSEPRVAYRPNG